MCASVSVHSLAKYFLILLNVVEMNERCRTRLSDMVNRRKVWVKPNTKIFNRRVRSYICCIFAFPTWTREIFTLGSCRFVLIKRNSGQAFSNSLLSCMHPVPDNLNTTLESSNSICLWMTCLICRTKGDINLVVITVKMDGWKIILNDI